MGIPLLSFGTWQNCRSAGLSSSAVLHVVNASPSSSLLSSSVVLPREVKMLAIVTAALLVLAANAEAAFVKYDYGGRESYKHEDYDSYKPSYDHKRGDDYSEPSHKSHYADQYYGDKPSYEVKDYSHRPHHDSYDADNYGRDAYSYRSKRSTDREGQACWQICDTFGQECRTVCRDPDVCHPACPPPATLT